MLRHIRFPLRLGTQFLAVAICMILGGIALGQEAADSNPASVTKPNSEVSADTQTGEPADSVNGDNEASSSNPLIAPESDDLGSAGSDSDLENETPTEAVDSDSAHGNRPPPLVTNDAIVFGLLMGILALVFWTHSLDTRFWNGFYKIFPILLLCYFLPSLLTTFGIVDPSVSALPGVAKKYLLPASLVLLTLSIDLGEVLKLGPKALVMFLTGTVGVILGGPIAILVVATVDPTLVGGSGDEAVWRGLSTVAGSWIGGGANQVAMKEIFQPSDDLFSVMLAVDIVIAEVWMAFLLLGISKAEGIDERVGADASSVRQLQEKMEHYSRQIAPNPSLVDIFAVLGVGFGVTAACHFAADILAPWIETNAPSLNKFSLNSAFFWLIVLATTGGVLLSFTRARQLEGAGASKIGTVCIFILVATIGLQMDILAVFEHPGLFVVGGIWMMFHVMLLAIVGKLIRAPYFFLAVGSKANIGGAASAPVVAAAFHPSLAPVGVLLAVVGYALGTYGAYICALMMQAVAPASVTREVLPKYRRLESHHSMLKV